VRWQPTLIFSDSFSFTAIVQPPIGAIGQTYIPQASGTAEICTALPGQTVVNQLLIRAPVYELPYDLISRPVIISFSVLEDGGFP
jgi:hypothetical protein